MSSGAAVVVKEATTVPRATATNAVGEYNFPTRPATGTVARHPGYNVYTPRCRIATQQFVTLDLPLEVGAIEESITVTADAPLIETSNASQGGVLDRQSLEDLPAAGRNAFMIGVTIPTVLSVGEPRFNRQQDQMVSSQLSLGGGGVQANNYTLDGVPITDMRGFPVLNPTIEAIDDVTVQVHTFDAEMGRTGGGVFNTTARSGANAFHGTAFYQDRPVWGQSLEYFSEKRGATKESSGLSESFYHPWRGIGGPSPEPHLLLGGHRGRDQVIPQGTRGRAPAAVGIFDDDAQRRASPHLQPVLPRRHRQREMPGGRHRLAGHRRRIHQRDHSPDAPRGEPGGVQDGQLLAAAAGRQREQPVERRYHGQLARLRRHADLQGRAQVHRPLTLSGLFIYNQTKGAASPVPDELSFLEQGANWLIRHPGSSSEQHQRAQRHAGHVVPLRLFRVSRWPELPEDRDVGCFSSLVARVQPGVLERRRRHCRKPVSRTLPELLGGRAEPEHGADQMEADYAERGDPLLGRRSKIGGDFRFMHLTLLGSSSLFPSELFTAGPGGHRWRHYAFCGRHHPGVSRAAALLPTYARHIQDDGANRLHHSIRDHLESGLREQDNTITRDDPTRPMPGCRRSRRPQE